MKFRVVFKRKGYKDILAGDAYIIEAKNVRIAKKEVKELLRNRFFSCEVPKIAYIDQIIEL